MNDLWSIPDPEDTLLQGDLLLRRDPATGRVVDLCLVITADCDISQRKFGRNIAALTVVPFKTYLRTIWADQKSRRSLAKATDQVLSQINKWNSIRIGKQSNISQEGVIDWVRRADGSEICKTLNVPAPDSSRFTSNINSYRQAVMDMESRSGDSFARLLAFKTALSGKPANDSLSDLLRDIRNENLPMDVFLLPDLPQIECGAAVIQLREIVGVPWDRVCYRTVDAITDQHYLRVGRLRETFKYAVSQEFGTLYSRIGLSTEYENSCKSVIAQLDQLDWSKA